MTPPAPNLPLNPIPPPSPVAHELHNNMNVLSMCHHLSLLPWQLSTYSDRVIIYTAILLWQPLNNCPGAGCYIWGLLCQKQVSMAGTSNFIPQILWFVITCLCPASCIYVLIFWWTSSMTNLDMKYLFQHSLTSLGCFYQTGLLFKYWIRLLAMDLMHIRFTCLIEGYLQWWFRLST